MQNLRALDIRLLACVLLFLSAGMGFCAEPEQDPVIGKWVWVGTNPVEVNADGTFSDLHMKGKWTYLPATSVERHYLFVWEGGRFVDKMTLSGNFDSLKGKNQLGDKVTAKRAIDLQK